MAITGGFGITMNLERGTTRQWVMGRDGVKRWADTNEPVDCAGPTQKSPATPVAHWTDELCD